MNAEHKRDHSLLSVPALERIDRVCLDFEAAWKTGPPPQIEQYLRDVQGAERSRLLQELMLLELDYRSRRDERPSVDEYRARFPQEGDLVAEVFDRLSTAAMDETVEPKGATLGKAPPTPKEFGDYELLEVLGEGGMGIVYRARQRSADRIVALKVIRPDRLATVLPEHRQKAVERFRAEAQAAARLEHDHIVTVHEVGQVDGLPFFSMRYVEGQGLDEVLRDGPLEDREAAALLEPVARAVDYAHGRGIIHRDLKPRNVLLDEQGRPYVADFGLAKSLEAAQELTQSGDLIGTPPYMSPEQAQGASEVGPASDVYSMGATLYELLTGRPPFRAASVTETLRQISETDPVPPRRLNPAVARDLETICLKCLEKEPPKRYATAEELADELQRFQLGEPIRARPITRLARAWRWCKRRPAVAGLAGLLAAVLLAVLVVAPMVAVHQASLRERAERLVEEKTALVGKLEDYVKEVDRQRTRAEANFQKALEAVDRLLTRVATYHLPHVPYMERARRELLEDALEFYQGFMDQKGDDPTVRAEVALAYCRVGGINRLLGEQAKAEQAYRRGIDGFKKLVDDFPDEPRYRHRLAGSYSDMSIGLADSGKAAEAEEVLQNALDLEAELHKRFPRKPEYVQSLTKIHQVRGFALEQLKRRPEAMGAYRTAIKLGRKLVAEHPKVSRHKDQLASAHNALGVLLKYDRRFPEAEAEYRKAVAWREERAKDLSYSPTFRSGLADVYSNLGDVLDEMDRPEEALEVLHKALVLRERNATEFPGIPWYQSALGATLNNVAKVLLHRQRVSEARDLLNQAINVQRKALDREPNNPTYKQFLCNHYFLLTKALLQLGEHAEAAEAALEPPRIYPDSGSHYCWALERLVECVRRARRDPTLAPSDRESVIGGYFELARQMLEGAIRWARGPDDYCGLSWVLIDHPEPALHDPQRAVELMLRAVEQSPESAVHRHGLGAALYRAGEIREAIEQLEKSNELSSGGDGSNWFYLAMAHWRLGDREVARQWYDKAIRWLKTYPGPGAELQRLAAEAAVLLGVATEPDPQPSRPERQRQPGSVSQPK